MTQITTQKAGRFIVSVLIAATFVTSVQIGCIPVPIGTTDAPTQTIINPVVPSEEVFEQLVGGEDKGCLDFWTIVHFFSGYSLGVAGEEKSFLPALVILWGYEVIEPDVWPGWFETEINQECDILVGWLGWAMGASEEGRD